MCKCGVVADNAKFFLGFHSRECWAKHTKEPTLLMRTRALMQQADVHERAGQLAWAIDHAEAAWHLATSECDHDDAPLVMEAGNCLLTLLKKARPR